MPAGYSKRTLPEKLGIKPGSRILILNAPANYGDTLGQLPGDVIVRVRFNGLFDFIQFFTKQKAELEKQFPRLKKSLRQDGMVWISWPKKSSKVETALNENVVRDIGLKNGLVDVKVCAVDEIWSGLKFVYRLRDRKF